MISNILYENIYQAIKHIGAMKYSQLLRLFNNHSPDAINWCLKKLLGENKIRMEKGKNINENLYYRRHSVEPFSMKQRLLTHAAWIMANMGEADVRAYWPMRYPYQLLIIGENDETYDIVVCNYGPELSMLQNTIPKTRPLMIPNGVEDRTIHIAIVPDNKEIVDSIRNLGFDSYCIFDENFVPHYFEF